MEINANTVVDTLNHTTKTIADAKNAVETGGITAAMAFINPIMDQFKDLQSFGKLEGITATSEGSGAVRDAIDQFLSNAKEIEDAVGPMGAAIFGKPEIVEVKSNLELVLARLKEDRGGKVKGTELEGGR